MQRRFTSFPHVSRDGTRLPPLSQQSGKPANQNSCLAMSTPASLLFDDPPRMCLEHACLVEALEQKAQTVDAKSQTLSTENELCQGRLDGAWCELEVRQQRTSNHTGRKLEDVVGTIACTRKMHGFSSNYRVSR